MTSNLLSRIIPSNHPARSIYEDLRAHDEASVSDIEEQAGMAIDEDNLGFHDEELGHADFGDESRITTESTMFLPGAPRQGRAETLDKGKKRSRWFTQSPRLLEEDGDDDVPQSLLVEDHDDPSRGQRSHPISPRTIRQTRQPPIPGPSNRETRAHWEAAQAQQRLHQDGPGARERSNIPQPRAGILSGSPREKAMWRWLNVTALDQFMQQVYDYYTGSGIWCIVLSRILDLLLRTFIAVFTTFLTQCVDFKKIPHSKALSEVLVPQCTKQISGMANVAIWLFTLFVIWRIYQLVFVELPRLLAMKDFFLYLLDIPDSDMQTISWQDVVAQIMALRDANPRTVQKISAANRKFLGSQSKARLDAHDIANRLMRKDNYLIALFNKETLDLTLPVPFLQGRQFFSRTMLWNLEWCIMDFVFNDNGQVRQLVLKDSHRRQLSNALRNRFLFAGFMNVILAPLIVVFLMIVYFFRYFKEYQSNPSAIGARQYTPLAEWKFREFNELEHLFQRRINMSHPFASRYLDQFPKVKMAQVARFVAFVAGAIVSVLVVATLWDPEMFLNFEITSERTVLFYVTFFGALWAITNGSIPDENLVFDPEYALRNVIDYTHYMPKHWADRLHSDDVKREFATLYQLKIVIFLEEVLSIIVTPFVLWFSLPKCSDQIIDFFREFTIHVDGVGYVCSFAVFDFKKGIGTTGNQHAGTSNDVREDYYSTKHGKMAASYYGFLDNYQMNPKTGIPGHLPPGMRQQFHPPPSIPGLASPGLTTGMQDSRLGRSERRRRSRGPSGIAPRTPRFSAAGVHDSMTSILLDPHHQPSTSGFATRRPSRTRFKGTRNIIEEPIEDEDEPETAGNSKDQYDSEPGLGESRWETSPTRGDSREDDEEASGIVPGGGGVLGLLYQNLKAQTATGRPGVNI